ncbi:unnamed protein product [Miscanthus lutarioriparius]|uniref:Uncharacterized protein n=1 Tax=Miscanthus lutarioriparius TaxID=422564 RepID=A0A811QMU3_9POAL|nr:unnamed protein product [Miscanthus lutarioriparius]
MRSGWPPIKMKRFPYAVYCAFGGMGRTGENLLAACVGIHYLLIMVNLLSFYTDGVAALLVQGFVMKGTMGRTSVLKRFCFLLPLPAEGNIEDKWWQTSVEAHHLMA